MFIRRAPVTVDRHRQHVPVRKAPIFGCLLVHLHFRRVTWSSGATCSALPHRADTPNKATEFKPTGFT